MKSYWIMVMVTVVFAIFKIVGTVQWSWVWVFAPMWIPVALAFVAGLVIMLVAKLFRVFL